MPEQLSLLSPDDNVHPAPTAGLLSLFLAIFPPPEDAAAIARQADELRERHGLKSERQAVGRLHVSLHNLGNFDGAVPRAHVDAAIAGAASVTCSRMRLVFDRALSFAGSNAFVLRCDADSDKAIAGLRQRLALALRRVGHAPEPSRTPHVTLLYDTRHVGEHAIEPIRWTATEFVLVLSHVGRTHHEWLARWPLTCSR